MKPDYKNWIPKGMLYSLIAGTVLSFALLLVFGVFGIGVSGKLRIALGMIFGIAFVVCAKYTEWCVHAYRSFSYDGERKLSKQIIEGTARYVPETEGNTLDFNGAYQALSEAVAGKKRTIDLNSCPAVYVKAAVMKDDPDLKNSLEECQNLILTKIVYIFGEETVTLEGDEIRNWLFFDERGRLQKNEDELRQCVAEYVAQLAATHDTVNTEREFCTTSGRTVQVYSSVYGWKIDQEKEIETIMQEMIAGVQINREPVYAMRANARGMNDIGSTYIEVDLSAQHLYYYQDGSIILESDIVSGDMQYAERQTPPGIFQLYYKKSPSVLKGKMLENGKYEYERPVTYWMPFNGGIGFHDASW